MRFMIQSAKLWLIDVGSQSFFVMVGKSTVWSGRNETLIRHFPLTQFELPWMCLNVGQEQYWKHRTMTPGKLTWTPKITVCKIIFRFFFKSVLCIVRHVLSQTTFLRDSCRNPSVNTVHLLISSYAWLWSRLAILGQCTLRRLGEAGRRGDNKLRDGTLYSATTYFYGRQNLAMVCLILAKSNLNPSNSTWLDDWPTPASKRMQNDAKETSAGDPQPVKSVQDWISLYLWSSIPGTSRTFPAIKSGPDSLCSKGEWLQKLK